MDIFAISLLYPFVNLTVSIQTFDVDDDDDGDDFKCNAWLTMTNAMEEFPGNFIMATV